MLRTCASIEAKEIVSLLLCGVRFNPTASLSPRGLKSLAPAPLYVRRDSDSNPTIDFEQTTGRLTGPGHES